MYLHGPKQFVPDGMLRVIPVYSEGPNRGGRFSSTSYFLFMAALCMGFNDYAMGS